MELSQREKYLIALAAIILLPLILFRFVIMPMSQSQTDLAKKISDLENKIEQVSLLGQEYNALSKQNRLRKLYLTPKVDSILRQYRLKSRSRIILDDQPGGKQKLVLKLDEIYLSELVKLLYRLENNKPVIIIENIDVSTSFKNKKQFRVSFALSSN